MKLNKSIIRIVIPAVIFCAVFLTSCMDVPRDNTADKWGDNFNNVYSDKSITAFSFVDPAVSGVINEAESTIIVYVQYGTSVENLAAEFTTNAESVTIYGREQRSGITVNDFSKPVYYTVTAQDGTSREYAVSTEFVSVVSFSVTDPVINETVNGIIDQNLKTINIQIPYYMNISRLKVSFNAVGTLYLNDTIQISGTTENDFSYDLNFEVEDENGVNQLYSVSTLYSATVSHYAGSLGGAGSNDGVGFEASFRQPFGITSDANNLFVADYLNHTIRKIDINTGNVTTLAGASGQYGSTDGIGNSARFNRPRGITTDGVNLFVTDNYNGTIRKIVISSGRVTTIAGSAGSYGHADGIGAAVTFNSPGGITTDGVNLYIADTGNHTIRRIIISSGVVSTIAGTALTSGHADGTGLAATFYQPYDITKTRTSEGIVLYITDTTNHTIRKLITGTGVVSTTAGTALTSGHADGTGLAATFYSPHGLTTDGENLYVTDGSNHTIRKIVISSGVVTTPAGTALTTGTMDGMGYGALFYYPRGITINNGNLYIVDGENHAVRKLVIENEMVSTFAGFSNKFGSTNGIGTEVRFYFPEGIVVAGTNIYVSDSANQTIRKIDTSNGETTLFAGIVGVIGGQNGPGNTARFCFPRGMATDGTNLYVCDSQYHTIRKIVISTREVSTIAGLANSSGSQDDIGVNARFNWPWDITTDGTNLYVCDKNNNAIRKIELSSGNYNVTTISTAFNSPRGITTDGLNLYVCNTMNHVIKKIVISTGVVSTFAGTGTPGADNGNSIQSSFNYPRGITTDGSNLYITEGNYTDGNHLIRKIILSSGVVSTIAGTAGITGNLDGAGAVALFNSPSGIAYYNKKLYVSDYSNNAIRVIYP